MRPYESIMGVVLLSHNLYGHVSGTGVDRKATKAYQPQTVACPTTPLIRPGSNISAQESQFITSRKSTANIALAAWLKKINAGFSTSTLPVLGLVHSGGGYRALLNAAGNMQAMDSRDSNSSISGLYQALTYQTALSGGAWFLNSLASHNWSTVSYLQKNIFDLNFPGGVLFPMEPSILYVGSNYAQIVADVAAKLAAGYPVTLVDIYGRLLGYNLFSGNDGGVNLTMSGLASLSNFTAHAAPYPIITSIGTNLENGTCATPLKATQYEFSPYEFGSWDNGTNAFVQLASLGSNLTNGTSKNGKCATGLDNLGFVTGTTGDVFPGICDPLFDPSDTLETLADALQSLLVEEAGPTADELFAMYPNPFYGSSHSPNVSQSKNLYLGDGALSNQTDAIWPLIQPARNVSVLIVTDSGGNDTSYYSTGIPIHATYLQAQAQNLTKMPFIPTPHAFVSQNLTMRAQFFGCDEPEAVTIVWLPLVSYTSTPVNINGFDLQVSKAMTDNIITNGNLIATQDNDAGWPLCLACAAMKKTGSALPSGCQACFTKYCYTTT